MQMTVTTIKSKFTIRKIIFLIILSLLIFFVLDRAVYLLFKSVSTPFYKKPFRYSATEKISSQAKNFYDTLILGSSRTKQGIHPWYLNKHLGLKAFKNSFTLGI